MAKVPAKQRPTAKTSSDALSWYQDMIKTAASGTRKRLLNAEDQQRGSTVMGKMFFFKYDPKHKATLPVYDIYPLVFPIERYHDGFLGLNLHYLSIPERQALLGQLTKYASAKNLTPKSRIRMTYDLLASTQSLASVTRPCIKRYLFTHVRSKFIEIPATEWDQVAALPIEMFVTKK